MYIPKTPVSKLEDFAQDLVRRCMQTQQERAMIYDLYKRYFLFGAADGVADYNKIYAHIDKVVSYIYSPGAVKFAIEIPDVISDDEKKMSEMCYRGGHEINRIWHDDKFDLKKEGIATLSLVFGSMFEKVMWKPKTDGPGPEMYAIEPSNIGVLREDLDELHQQEVICHSYYMTAEELWRILKYQEGGRAKFERVSFMPSIEVQPPMNALQQMIVSSSSPNMVGSNAPDLSWPSTMFRPQVITDACECYELWCWDDSIDDYWVITIANPNVMIFSRANFHLPRDGKIGGKHPFVQTKPFPLTGYFYGISEVFFLLGLQAWHEKRLRQIQRLQDLQVDPPTAASGFTGITDEQIRALNEPGGMLRGEIPNAKIEHLAPDMPSTIFEEVGGIEGFFRDMSGMSDILEGKGTQGVRGSEHAMLLALYGGSRIKKKGLAVEYGVAASANQIYHLARRYDPTHMKVAISGGEPLEFVMAQLSDEATVKVDAHSHSPAFSGDHREEADKALKMGAISKEEWLEYSNLPGKARLKSNLREREAAAAKNKKEMLEKFPKLAAQEYRQMLKG